MTDLRTLAQAVVRCAEGSHAWRIAMDCLLGHTGIEADTHQCRTILAALDAAEAQGYARAMGEQLPVPQPVEQVQRPASERECVDDRPDR